MRSIVGLVTILLLGAACGSSSSPAQDQSDDRDEPDETVAAPTDPPAPQQVTEVAVLPGGLSVGQVDIDGTSVDYVTVVPEGFEVGDTAPVLLALPPGGQDLGLAESIAGGVYQTEALARGWVVVSPAAPGGELFFRGSEALIGGLLEWMEGWVTAEGGMPHLSGISNGGISAFRALAENPTSFRSVLVFPRLPPV